MSAPSPIGWVKDLRDAGNGTARVEGVPVCDWVLVDASDVIVHVFRPEVRAFYNLEKMWSAGATERDPSALEPIASHGFGPRACA